MLKEFKAFALQGNMLDMAIGIIIGAAFGTIVTSLVNDILMPVLAVITGSPDFSNLFVLLKAPEGADVNMASVDDIRKAGGVVLAYGVFINALIAFLIVALALFFVVKGMNKMKKAEAPAPTPAPAGPTAEELLADIRDLLRKG